MSFYKFSLDELKRWVDGGWQVCLHFEAGPHPLVGDVWSHGGILEESTKHADLWVPVGKGPSVKESLVVDVLGLTQDLCGKGVELVLW